MSKEKFVRSKPHVNIGLFIVVLAIFAMLTYYLPQQIPPGSIAFPVESALRPEFGVLVTQSLLNGVFYGVVGVIGFQAISRVRN